MKGTNGLRTRPKTSLLCICLLITALFLIAPVSADAESESLMITFQDLGVISNQTIRVFDDTGTIVATTTTDGTVNLCYNLSEGSSMYTFQIQPSAGNVQADTMMNTMLSYLKDYWLLLVFLIVILYAIPQARRRK